MDFAAEDRLEYCFTVTRVADRSPAGDNIKCQGLTARALGSMWAFLAHILTEYGPILFFILFFKKKEMADYLFIYLF